MIITKIILILFKGEYDKEYLVNSYCLTLDNQNRVRYVSKADPDSSKTNFFNFLKEELESVAKHYRKSIDEVHTKFMEVSCDFGVLKYILEQEKVHNDIKTSSKYSWNGLEDLAVQESKNSIQFKGLAMEKTKYEIKKRQEFLKTLKDLKFEKDN